MKQHARCPVRQVIVAVVTVPLTPEPMRPSPLRHRLATLHRWTALLLTPVFAAVLLSGAVLALEPMLAGRDRAAPPAHPLDVNRLLAVLDSVDPGHAAPFVAIGPERTTIMVARSRREGGWFDLATGRPAAPPPDVERADVFSVARRVHERLWFGLEGLVGLATVAMVLLVLAGPFLARPGSGGRTPLGWHIKAGWVLWPLFLLLPLSVGLMKMHPRLVSDRTPPPASPRDGIAAASRQLDLGTLAAAQGLPGGVTFLVLAGEHGVRRYVVRNGTVTSADSRVATFGRLVHEGTWAGPLSGAINLVGALGLLAMMLSGITSWRRRAA